MSAHGKHTRNPGYGSHWVVCDVCGFDIRADDARTRWDGMVVCPDDFELRHPQDFVQAQEDHIVANEPVRTPPDPDYVRTVPDPDETVPSGTFNEETL